MFSFIFVEMFKNSYLSVITISLKFETVINLRITFILNVWLSFSNLCRRETDTRAGVP